VGTTDPPEMILQAGPEESTTWCCVPQWSPLGDWIAYEANSGLNLVSPDGLRRRLLSATPSTAFAWSSDGSKLYSITQRPDRRASLISVDVRTGKERTIRTFDVDVSFETPLNPGLRASVSPDGRNLLTTAFRTRADIWMLDGIAQKPTIFDRVRAMWRHQ